MMFTTTLTVALASVIAANSAPGLAAWQTDYSKAVDVSAEVQKPIAVFLTDGSQNRILEQGALSADVAKLLREKYVAVHVDTTTAQGKKLADSFGLQVGLVISDRVGHLQALRHEGRVTDSTLTSYLTRFAAGAEVITTEHHSATAPGATSAPAPAPSYVTPTFAPHYYNNFQPFTYGRGTCPNCR
jgi:hypothetical protein